MEWATLPLKKYADFTGRARRKEYWSFWLLTLVAYFLASLVGSILGDLISSLLVLAVAVGFFIPSLAAGVRRLHDTNRSGWWLLISLVPIVGSIILIVFLATDGNRGPNDYGPDPKMVDGGVAERFA